MGDSIPHALSCVASTKIEHPLISDPLIPLGIIIWVIFFVQNISNFLLEESWLDSSTITLWW